MRIILLTIALTGILANTIAAGQAYVEIHLGPTTESVTGIYAPTSVAIELPSALYEAIQAGRGLELQPVDNEIPSTPISAQFIPDEDHALRGMLWWLTPTYVPEKTRYRLADSNEPVSETLHVRRDDTRKWMDVFDGNKPVLRYNHGVTEVPEGVDPAFERGDYLHPIYSLKGQPITDDFPTEYHPHHRGLCWAWAVVRWDDEVRDMWAVRNPFQGEPLIGGLWSRPSVPARITSGPVLAVIEAESEWLWDDETPIVHQEIKLHAFRGTDAGRIVDITLRLEALVDHVEIGGRPEAGYSGFCARMAPGEEQQIQPHIDTPESSPRRAWADYAARYDGTKSGMTIFQHPKTPMYPSEWIQYPELNFYQPGFPGGGDPIPLVKGEPMTLRFRLLIHDGSADEKVFTAFWDTFAETPDVYVDNN